MNPTGAWSTCTLDNATGGVVAVCIDYGDPMFIWSAFAGSAMIAGGWQPVEDDARLAAEAALREHGVPFRVLGDPEPTRQPRREREFASVRLPDGRRPSFLRAPDGPSGDIEPQDRG